MKYTPTQKKILIETSISILSRPHTDEQAFAVLDQLAEHLGDADYQVLTKLGKDGRVQISRNGKKLVPFDFKKAA